MEVFDPTERHPFVDAWKRSMKAMFLNNGNKYHIVFNSICHSHEESYETMNRPVNHAPHDEYSRHTYLWRFESDCYTIFCCFLCEWRSRAWESHCSEKQSLLEEQKAEIATRQSIVNTQKYLFLPRLPYWISFNEIIFVKAIIGRLYQPRMMDDGCEAVGGIIMGRGNRSTRRKPGWVPLCPPQIPHDLNWTWTRTAAVGSRRLAAWAMARPQHVP
jgi:hypothetical protein